MTIAEIKQFCANIGALFNVTLVLDAEGNPQIPSADNPMPVVGVDIDPAGLATSELQGALTETAPVTDTASSGLNGRLQRIAQRLTSLIDSFANGTNKIKLWDGTNNAQIEAYSVATLATDKALKTSTVIHGLNSGGGGAYIDVKVNPSGALTVEANITDIAGSSIYYLANAAAKAEIKASAGTLKKIFGENKVQETSYIQIFNALAANVTLGTTPPTYVIPIAASGFFEFDLNITHSTAISYAVTDTETGLTTAALSTLNIAYQ